MLMMEKAMRLAEKGAKVAFFLPAANTLLALDMQTRFQSHFNLAYFESNTVETFQKYQDHHAVFIDELSIETESDIAFLQNMAVLHKDRVLWLATTPIASQSLLDRLTSVLQHQYYEIPTLVHPLRNSTSIVEFAHFGREGNQKSENMLLHSVEVSNRIYPMTKLNISSS